MFAKDKETIDLLTKFLKDKYNVYSYLSRNGMEVGSSLINLGKIMDEFILNRQKELDEIKIEYAKLKIKQDKVRKEEDILTEELEKINNVQI